MSYRVEITATSVTELAGKLLALAATMQAVPVDPVMEEVKAASKPKKVKAEAAEQAPVDPTPGQPTPEISAPPSDTSSAPKQEQTSSTSSNTEHPSEPLDFDKDVAPVVLGAVKVKGKPWVQEVLSQFGVERASQVPVEQLPELIAALADGAA